jgi:hypothetical protein
MAALIRLSYAFCKSRLSLVRVAPEGRMISIEKRTKCGTA